MLPLLKVDKHSNLFVAAIFIFQLTSAQQNNNEESSGLGGAELVAIGVCSLIVIAFCMVCFIMVRNANKRKKLNQNTQKLGEGSQRVPQHSLSDTQARDHSFAYTGKVPVGHVSRNQAATRDKSLNMVYESSEYDSEDVDRVNSFSAYGNRLNKKVLEKQMSTSNAVTENRSEPPTPNGQLPPIGNGIRPIPQFDAMS